MSTITDLLQNHLPVKRQLGVGVQGPSQQPEPHEGSIYAQLPICSGSGAAAPKVTGCGSVIASA